MRIYSYNNEIKTMTAQVIDLFNNTKIKRFKDNLEKFITVPCVYGNRSRILKELENRNPTLKLPLMVVTILSIERDSDRVHSVNDSLYFSKDGEYNMRYNIAVPIQIEMNLSIIGKYQKDVEQLISNFAIHMNPQVYVVWDNPLDTTQKIKSAIYWNGISTPTFTDKYKLDGIDPQRYIIDCGIVAKTWIFPGSSDDVPELASRIDKINLSNTYDNAFNKFYEVPTYMSIDEYSDNIEAGLIKYPNYDELNYSEEFSATYWPDLFVEMNGDIYNPRKYTDLEYIVTNWDTQNPHVTSILMENLPLDWQQVDFYDVFTRMYSGDLSGCFMETPYDNKLIEKWRIENS
jgi:hypothetical protein